MSGIPPEPEWGTDDWLVIIDPQRIFADPTSQWGSPMWPAVVGRIVRLAAAYGDRVVVTRFVADPRMGGSWEPYYREWPFALVPDENPLYAVVRELGDVAARAARDGRIVTLPTFGKWHADLREITGDQPRMTLAGVSTDCCVLATALPAADAGATVRIAASACAGSTPENHQRALDVMALFGPQIVIAD